MVSYFLSNDLEKLNAFFEQFAEMFHEEFLHEPRW